MKESLYHCLCGRSVYCNLLHLISVPRNWGPEVAPSFTDAKGPLESLSQLQTSSGLPSCLKKFLPIRKLPNMYSFEPHRIHGTNGFLVATFEWLISMVYIQTHATFYINCIHIILLNWSLFLSVATLSHWTSNLAVSHLECIFELLFLLVALLATHPPRECMSSWGQVELRMTSWNQGLYVKTLWKVLTWRQFPCFFLAGNTNLHSGSIFQPSTLVYWRGNGMMLLVSMNYDGMRLENSTHGFSRFFGW